MLPPQEPTPGVFACSLVVCNPFRGMRQLPLLSVSTAKDDATYGVSGTFVVSRGSKSNCYNFFLSILEISDDHVVWTLHVYSSETGAWIQHQKVPDSTFQINELYYILGRNDLAIYNLACNRNNVLSVIAYKLVEGGIETMLEMEMPGRTLATKSRALRAVLEYAGNVYVVNETQASPGVSSVLQIGLWRLDQERSVWEEVSVMPEEMSLEKGFNLEEDIMILNGAVGIGDAICLDVDIYFLSQQFFLQIPPPPQPVNLLPVLKVQRHMVTYEVMTGKWHVATRIGEDETYRAGTVPAKTALTTFGPRIDVMP